MADTTGIAHLFLDWSSRDGTRTGRICVDPRVQAGAWRCQWDTSTLAPGSYTVTMVAVDAAGNRGSFEQAYRVEAVVPDANAPRSDTAPLPESPEPVVPEMQTPDAEAAAVEAAAPEREPELPSSPDPAPIQPEASTDEPITVTPAGMPLPLAVIVEERLVECSQLELAPGVAADRALSLAVLDCMRPALEALGAAEPTLDEIPVPPAIVVTLPDARALDAAEELLPDAIGGVGLTLELAEEHANDS